MYIQVLDCVSLPTVISVRFDSPVYSVYETDGAVTVCFSLSDDPPLDDEVILEVGYHTINDSAIGMQAMIEIMLSNI